MKNKRPRTAFTFIELSIVLALIALIAATVVGGSAMITSSRLAAARTATLNSPVREIPGLQLWLETTLKDSFVVSERDSASHAISTWYDQNPQMDYKKNATTGNAPTYTAGGMNLLPVLRFNGSSNYLNFDGSFLVGSDYTIFVVEQRRSNGGGNVNYFIAGTNGVTNGLLHLGYRSDTLITHAQFGNDYDIAVSGYGSPIPRIHAYTQNSITGKKYYQNGGSPYGTANGSAANTTPLVSFVGSQIGRYSTTNFFNGDIAEIIMFSRTLSDVERQDVEIYLSKKWGIKFY